MSSPPSRSFIARDTFASCDAVGGTDRSSSANGSGKPSPERGSAFQSSASPKASSGPGAWCDAAGPGFGLAGGSGVWRRGAEVGSVRIVWLRLPCCPRGGGGRREGTGLRGGSSTGPLSLPVAGSSLGRACSKGSVVGGAGGCSGFATDTASMRNWRSSRSTRRRHSVRSFRRTSASRSRSGDLDINAGRVREIR